MPQLEERPVPAARAESGGETIQLKSEVVFGPALRRGGKTRYYVKNGPAGGFLLMGEKEQFVLRQMDGTRSIAQIEDCFEQRYGRRAPAQFWSAVVNLVKSRGLLAGTAPAASPSPEAQAIARSRKGPLEHQFRIVDPNRFLGYLVERLPFLFHPAFVLAGIVAILIAEAMVLVSAGAVVADAVKAPSVQGYGVWAAFGLCLMLSSILHETAHGATCRRFGGSVNDMGIMFRYLAIYPYCRLDDIVLLPKVRHRVWVALAGTFTSLLVMVPFAFVWRFSEGATFAHGLSAMMLCLYNVSALMNFMPFMQLDGYLAIACALGMPEFRRDALEYWSARARELLRKPFTMAPYSTVERRILAGYGIAAGVLTTASVVLALFRWQRFFAVFLGKQNAVVTVVVLLVVLLKMRGAAIVALYQRWRQGSGS